MYVTLVRLFFKTTIKRFYMDRVEYHNIDRLKERGVKKRKTADIPTSEVGNDLCSTRQTLETGRSVYGPSWALQYHLEQKLKLKLASLRSDLCNYFIWDFELKKNERMALLQNDNE